MLFVKKIIILSGERTGVLKLESNGGNMSGSLSITPLPNTLKIGIKMGEAPIFVQSIAATKTNFRLPIGSNIDGNIAVVALEGSANRLVGSGSNYKNCQYQQLACEMLSAIKFAEKRGDVRPPTAEKSNATAQNSNDVRASTAVQNGDVEEKLSVVKPIVPPGEMAEQGGKLGTVPRNVSQGTLQAQHLIKDCSTQEVFAKSAEVIAETVGDATQTEDAIAPFDNGQTHDIVGVVIGNDTDGEMCFYDKIKDRLTELMTSYPHDAELEATVHASQWVRVDYDDGNYYVVGLIEEDGTPMFICYGVPVESRADSISDNKSMCEWLPLQRDEVNGRGYWVLYQSCVSGETLS